MNTNKGTYVHKYFGGGVGNFNFGMSKLFDPPHYTENFFDHPFQRNLNFFGPPFNLP